MQESELVALLALVFALGMSVPDLIAITSVACGLVMRAQNVTTEHELFAALSDLRISRIVLDEHIIVESPIVINRESRLILDLHGHNLISCSRGHNGFGFGKNRAVEHVPVIDIQSGQVELTGAGHVMALGAVSPAIRLRGAMTAANENYSSLVVDKSVVINAPNYCGIYIAPNGGLAYGITVDFAGTMVAHDGIYLSGNIQGTGPNVPHINLRAGAKVLVDEHAGVAIRAAGCGIWHLDKAELAGGTGIIAQAGQFTLSAPTIATAGEFQYPAATALATPNTGAIVQIEPSPNHNGDIELTINGGDYTSTQSYVFTELTATENFRALQIQDGRFVGKNGIFYGLAPHGADGAATQIFGGDFNSEVAGFLASGHYLEKNSHEPVYTVVDASKSRAEAKLAQAESELQHYLDLAERFLEDDYSAGDLGDWRSRITPVLASLKRTRTAVGKLLRGKPSTEKLVAATRSLARATDRVQAIEDDLRAEVATAVAAVEAVDPQDYSNYSYHELKTAATAANKILLQENPGLETLYSALLDVEINIDLLEERSADEGNLPAEVIFKPAAKPPVPKKPSIFDLPPVTAPAVEVDPELETAKTRLRTLLKDVSSPDPAEYTSESYATLAAATSRAGNFLAELPITATALTLENYYHEVSAAYQGLVKKSDDPESVALETARTNLLVMLEAVKDLRVDDYEATAVEQFGELQVAIAKAETLLSKAALLPSEIVAAMDEITAAMSGLRAPQTATVEETAETAAVAEAAVAAEPPIVAELPAVNLEVVDAVDWAPLQEVVTEIAGLEAADYTAHSYARVLECLESAKTLLGDQSTTQTQIEDAVFDLNLAVLALEPNTPPRLSESEQFDTAEMPKVPDFAATVEPNWLMSMMAGAYAGVAAYRQSRLLAKQQRRKSR